MPLPNGELAMGSGHLSSFVEVMPSVIWNSKQICGGPIFCLQDFRNRVSPLGCRLSKLGYSILWALREFVNVNGCSSARTLVVELTFGLAGSFLRVIFPRPSDSSASSAVFGLAAPMRLVRFSSSSLELDRSDPHSDVFVDDASLQLVRFFFFSFHLVLKMFLLSFQIRQEMGRIVIMPFPICKEMGRIVVLLEGRIVMILEGFLLDCKLGSSTLRLPQLMLLRGFLLACKLGSSTPLLHCWKYLQCWLANGRLCVMVSQHFN